MLLLIELGKPFDFLWKLAAYPDTSNHFNKNESSIKNDN